MFWFDVFFPPCMIAFPWMMTLLIRTRPEERPDVDRKGVRALTLLLVSATIVCITIYFVLRFAFELAWMRQGWVMCFLLLPLAIIVMNRKSPRTMIAPSGNPQQTRRSATLVNRFRLNPIPGAYWLIGWFIWLAGLIAILGRVMTGFPDSQAQTRWSLALTLQVLLIGGGLALAQIMLPRMAYESEPMDPDGSEDIVEMYHSLRRFRMWAMFWLFGLFMPLIMSAGMNMLVWIGNDPHINAVAGAAGGIIGGLGGIAGAVVGTICTQRRRRINLEIDQRNRRHISRDDIGIGESPHL